MLTIGPHFIQIGPVERPHFDSLAEAQSPPNSPCFLSDGDGPIRRFDARESSEFHPKITERLRIFYYFYFLATDTPERAENGRTRCAFVSKCFLMFQNRSKWRLSCREIKKTAVEVWISRNIEACL